MSRNHFRRFHGASATSAAIAAFLLSNHAWAQSKTFDVVAQSAETGVAAFARQADVQVLISARDAQGKNTKPVHGDHSVLEGLNILLAGTGLVAQETGAQTYTVVPTGRPTRPTRLGDANQASPGEGQTPLEEIVVTGTNIRGVRNLTSPVITIDRDSIEKSGYSNTEDLVRSVPQNFGGGSLGATADGNIGPGASAGSNVENGTAVNLRGLGETSTLTLIDGHRVAASGFGGFVDVSTIPLLALERVEIVTDGASALYGSDAVAGVANFILRKNFDGAETDVRVGTVTNGGLNNEMFSQVLGKQWGTGGGVLTFQYENRTALSASERSFTATAPEPTNIVNPFSKYSLALAAHQDLLENLEFTGDALLNRNDTSEIRTSSGGHYNIFVEGNTANLSGGLRYRAFGDWEIDGSIDYSKEAHSFGFNAYPSPRVPLGIVVDNYDDTLVSYNARANGTLFELPNGPVKIALGVTETNDDASNKTNPAYGGSDFYHRDILAEYGEVNIPLFEQESNLPMVERLSLSAAFRHDHYSDFGDTTNPKVGVLWTPVPDIDVRGSWGTAFRAPRAGETFQQQAFGVLLATFPFGNPNGPGTIPAFINDGASQHLMPETAETWTIGFDYHPSFVPGLKLSFDYYDVDYRNRIIMPPFDTSALRHPGVYGSLITHLPSDAAAKAFLANFLAQPGAKFLDITGTGPTGIRYIYDASLQNAAVLRQSGFDVQGNYTFSSGENTFDIRLNMAIINHIETQFSSTSTPTNLANTYSNPLEFRMRDDFTWSRGEWQINTALNFSNGYTDTSASPYGTIDAYATVDLNIRYTPDYLPGVTASLTVTNLADEAPPFAHGGIGEPGIHYDVGNADPFGRMISFEIKKTW